MDAYVAKGRQLVDSVDWKAVQALTYEWKFVLTFATLYVVTVKLANRSRPKKASSFSQTQLFKWLCVLHNAALAVYSLWTFVSALPIVLRRFSNTTIPIQQRLCDNRGEMFDEGLDWLAYLFYLSKFYEVIDTAIILAKGKKSPLLQTYHHAGAMITMFSGAKFRATGIWLFVVFNSFIHSIMYVYYTFSTLKLPFPRPLKKSLTTLQISQFLIGGSWAASHLLMEPEDGTACLPDFGAKLATWLNVLYLMPLTTLFVQFFVNEYRRPKNSAKVAADKAGHAVNKSLKTRAT